MQIVRSPEEMRQVAEAARRGGENIALVPTMGFLHDGHLALIREGRRRAGLLVVSLFVNPIQFDPNEDFARYPRDLVRDCALMERVPVDIVFAPEADAMYRDGAQTWVEVGGEVTQGLCSPFRAGHFRGVTTVVAKLFNIVRPTLAVFGEKDFQQLRAIQRMVADLNFGIEIVPVPIVREPDGLAMSSRNAYLSLAERKQALALSHGLFVARARFESGREDPAELVRVAREVIAQSPEVRVQYIEAVDADTLGSVSGKDRPILLAVAAYVGQTRLIDNIVLRRPAA